MTKEDLAWDSYKLLLGKSEQCSKAMSRAIAILIIILIGGFVMHFYEVSGERDSRLEFSAFGGKVKLPRTFLVIILPILVSTLYARVVSLIIWDLTYTSTLKEKLVQTTRGEAAEETMLKTLLNESKFWFIRRSLLGDALSIRLLWTVVLVQWIGFWLVAGLLPIAGISYFILRVYAVASLWISITITVFSTLMTVGSVIVLFQGIRYPYELILWSSYNVRPPKETNRTEGSTQ